MMWEYKTCMIISYLEESSLESTLNKFGKEGWELVNIIPQISSDSDSSYGDVDLNITCCESVKVDYNVAVFKRKKTETE